VQSPLRRAHLLRAITLASPIKKARPYSTERAPTAWHTNDEYKNADASEEASDSSAVANASEHKVLPILTYSLCLGEVEIRSPGDSTKPRASATGCLVPVTAAASRTK
jgi:hypothetical protein